jgi:lysophospholipase L1-like esterase
MNKVQSLGHGGRHTRKGEVSVKPSHMILHVGGNDVMRVGSEKIVADYERLLVRAGEVNDSLVVTGIVPRYSQDSEWSSRAIGINVRIESLCNRLGIQFIDLWDGFYGNRSLYAKDGTHFSCKGVATLGRDIDDRLYKLDRLEREGNF